MRYTVNMVRKSKKKIKMLKNWHIAVFVSALIIVLLLAVKQTSVPEEIKSLSIVSISYGNGLSMTLKNEEPLAAECVAVFEQGKMPLGTFGPGMVRDVNLNVLWNLEKIDCIWQDIDVSGCEDTSLALCPYKHEQQLAECMDYDIPYQHFCAALITKNSSLCGFIYEEPRMTHCYAYIDKKPELCGSLTVGRDWCYQDFAMNTGRKELCDFIVNKQKAQSCLSVVTGDMDLCKSLSDNIGCLVHFIEASGDSSLCEFANDKEYCYDNLYS